MRQRYSVRARGDCHCGSVLLHKNAEEKVATALFAPPTLMTNRDIAKRVMEEIELLQASSKEIGIPWRLTAIAIIEDALAEAMVNDVDVVTTQPVPAWVDFEWPGNEIVK